LGIDDEHGAYGLGAVLAGHDHPVLAGDLHRDVLDEREGDLDALHALELDLVLDRAEPCDVAVEAVDRQADQLGVQGGELVLHRGERHELGRAHGGEVGRVAEEDHPAAGVVGWERDLALRGHSGESGAGSPIRGIPVLTAASFMVVPFGVMVGLSSSVVEVRPSGVAAPQAGDES